MNLVGAKSGVERCEGLTNPLVRDARLYTNWAQAQQDNLGITLKFH